MKIKIPNSWEGVTLREFQAVTKLLKDTDEKLSKLKGAAKKKYEFELECALISTLSGEDMNDILQLYASAHNDIMNRLAFLYSPVEGNIKTKATINGRKYYFEKNVKNITGGQWITLMHFLTDESKVDENLHNLIACFAYERGWFKNTYQPELFEQTAEDMLELPVSFVKPITDFFLSDWVNSVRNTAVYLEVQGERLKRKAERELRRSKHATGGSTPSTASQTVGMTSDLTI